MGLTGHSYGSLMMCCQHIPNCTLFRCWVCLWADHCCNGSSRNGQFRSSGLQLLGAGLVLVFVLIVHVWIIVSVSGMRVWAQEVLCGHCWVNHWTMKIAGSGSFVVSSSPPPPSSSSPSPSSSLSPFPYLSSSPVLHSTAALSLYSDYHKLQCILFYCMS